MVVPEKVARLPPLPKLRVRRPNKQQQNPCVGVMSQLLGCWASSGYGIEGCGKLEEALRQCMDNQKKAQQPKSTINYHLSRFYHNLIGPHKRNR
ncbi:CHCH domain-containing protein [Sphaerosporella brunnea]|uniref:Small ribosomal subunit protein mS37 n=1 Tax=Sphaerosporella brunnea TaxID=1250544 RepID=A0A5J5F524_9PEZI|nr:CHCH domain-containing protein [Sphaerosporella brunnea]